MNRFTINWRVVFPTTLVLFSTITSSFTIANEDARSCELRAQADGVCQCQGCDSGLLTQADFLPVPKARPKNGFGAGPITINGPHVFRIAYLIPSNRSPQAMAVNNLRWVATKAREWFGEQMDRNGFGPKTLQLELEPDGVTPKIHVLGMTGTDAY